MTSPTFECTYEEFRCVAADYFRALETVKSYEELQAAHGCLALHYLGIRWDENNPLDRVHRTAGAPALMRVATQYYVDCELRLEHAEVA